jgi:hypothetical protein
VVHWFSLVHRGLGALVRVRAQATTHHGPPKRRADALRDLGVVPQSGAGCRGWVFGVSQAAGGWNIHPSWAFAGKAGISSLVPIGLVCSPLYRRWSEAR